MKKQFLTGLAILLPLVLTLAITAFLVNLLTKPFVGAVTAFLDHFHLLDHKILFINARDFLLFSIRVVIIGLLFLLTVFVGFIARWFFIHELLRLNDWIFHRIPLVNRIYKASQDVIQALFHHEVKTLSQVVMVPFPHDGGLSIGVVTGEIPAAASPFGDRMLSIFVPGAPNPTMGFLLVYKPEQVIHLDMPVEEAMKCIVACGLLPVTFNANRPS
jgi:uncharacterized membrane protein